MKGDSNSWQMFQWRHWQPSNGIGRKGRWGKWHKCTREEYERTDNNACTQKRVLTCTPKPVSHPEILEGPTQ